MADNQEKTEVYYYFNIKGTSSFYYANRYGTEEKSILDFVYSSKEY